jgi:hypothetical protein
MPNAASTNAPNQGGANEYHKVIFRNFEKILGQGPHSTEIA